MKAAADGRVAKPPISVFNTVINACEICNEEGLTQTVLDTMKRTHDTDGNIITFNIALKRLARKSDVNGCEQMLVNMLDDGVEPTVVSYTTAVAACVGDDKNPSFAYEWVKRMRTRNVMPNIVTYNTALAACIDGKLESTILASKLAAELYDDFEKQREAGFKGDPYTKVIPNKYTKNLCRQLLKQLQSNCRDNEIDERVAKATVRVPLLRITDFDPNEVNMAGGQQAEINLEDNDEIDTTSHSANELDFAVANENTRRTAEV